MNYFQIINDCKYLSLAHLSEIKGNVLKLLVEEAIVREEGINVDIGDATIKVVHPIVTTNDCRKFEFTFERYIAYTIRNESFALADQNENFNGRLYRVYQSSPFLDYIRKGTFASDQHPGPFKHYGIECQDHIIDVVSAREPSIRMYY